MNKKITSLMACVATVALGASLSVSAAESSSGKYGSGSKYSSSKSKSKDKSVASKSKSKYSRSANPRMKQGAAAGPFSGFLPSGVYVGVMGSLGISDISARLNIDSDKISGLQFPGVPGAPALKASQAVKGPYSSKQFDQAGLFGNLQKKSAKDSDSDSFVSSIKMDNPMALGIVAGFSRVSDSGIMFGVEGAFDMYLFKNIASEVSSSRIVPYIGSGEDSGSPAVVNALLEDYWSSEADGKKLRNIVAGKNAEAVDAGLAPKAELLVAYFGKDIPKALPDAAKVVYKKYSGHSIVGEHGGANLGAAHNIKDANKVVLIPIKGVPKAEESVEAKSSIEKKFSVAGRGLLGMVLPGSKVVLYGSASYILSKYKVSVVESVYGVLSDSQSKEKWLGSFGLGVGGIMNWEAVSLRAEYIHGFKSDAAKLDYMLNVGPIVIDRGGVEYRAKENIFRVGLMFGL